MTEQEQEAAADPRGDDPAWRPEGERSESDFDSAVTNGSAARACREHKPEQPAAGIKVGDRVRRADGYEGDVTDFDPNTRWFWVTFANGFCFPYPMADIGTVWTIIPPAAAPDPDDAEQPEPPTPQPYESVDHPPHYGGDSPHEVIKFIEAHDLGFNAGNVVKYVVRAGRKPGEDKVKDLEKAVWYLNRIVAAAKGNQ